MRTSTLAGLIVLSLTVLPAYGDWDTSWSNGFKFDNKEEGHSLKIGGRLQSDFAFFDEDDELAGAGFEDGSEFRRARIYVSGTFSNKIVFKAQYDWANGNAEIKDGYIGLIDLGGIDELLFGHMFEPFSLEQLTSSKYITFMERALPVEAFAPARNTGVRLNGGQDRWSWDVGAFYDADDSGDTTGNEINLTGRLTFVPWYESDTRLLHLGVGVTDRSPVDDGLRIRSRPEAHLSPRVVDTGTIAADGLLSYNLEAALVSGPWSFQGEYYQASADTLSGADPDFDGFYVFGSYFLTGESRNYDGNSFGRTKPSDPLVGDGGGSGAWEVAIRFSSLDLSDAGFNGGEVDDITLGLNWYPLQNVRWMLNLVQSDIDGVGDVNVLQTRFHVDF